MVGTQRGAPDVSFDASPNSGVWVYDSTSCHGMSGLADFWRDQRFLAGSGRYCHLAGSFASSSAAELETIYSVCATGPASTCSSADFRDVTSGKAGSFTAKTGWDFVTGVGSDVGIAGK